MYSYHLSPAKSGKKQKAPGANREPIARVRPPPWKVLVRREREDFMCCHIRSASASRRRRIKVRQAPTLPSFAMLDLSKPGERQAYEFLLRTTNPKDQMWTVLDLRRHGDLLLCVVRWVHPETKSKPYAMAEVSLTETAVCWRDHATTEAAWADMEQRCARTTLAACPK